MPHTTKLKRILFLCIATFCFDFKLFSGSFGSSSESNADMMETTGEEKQNILNRLGIALPYLSGSNSIVSHCSMKMQRHTTPVFVSTACSHNTLIDSQSSGYTDSRESVFKDMCKPNNIHENVNINSVHVPNEMNYM